MPNEFDRHVYSCNTAQNVSIAQSYPIYPWTTINRQNIYSFIFSVRLWANFRILTNNILLHAWSMITGFNPMKRMTTMHCTLNVYTIQISFLELFNDNYKKSIVYFTNQLSLSLFHLFSAISLFRSNFKIILDKQHQSRVGT